MKVIDGQKPYKEEARLNSTTSRKEVDQVDEGPTNKKLLMKGESLIKREAGLSHP